MSDERWMGATRLRSPTIAFAARLELSSGAAVDIGAPSPSVLVIEQGHLEVQVGTQRTILAPGGVAQVRTGQVLAGRADRRVSAWWLRVVPTATGPVLAETFQSLPRFADALKAAALQQPVSEEACQQLEQWAVAATAGLSDRPPPDTPVGRIAKLALDRLGERVSLKDMGAVSGLEKHTMLRRFRRATGKTPAAFFVALRLGATLGPLANGARPVDIAHTFGFSDQSHFIRRFAAAYGTTPGAFRAGRSAPARRKGGSPPVCMPTARQRVRFAQAL